MTKLLSKNSNPKIAICLLICLSIACTKTKAWYLNFTSTDTPNKIKAGQTIVSKVQLTYFTTSFDIAFKGFQSTETGPHRYSVGANATIQTDGQTSANTLLWVMDTTYSIKTTDTGQYVLNFYNGADLFKSDTISVL